MTTKEKETQVKVTIKDLLTAGAHFGHQRYRWNPKMKRFIFEERGGIYIIDLAKTMQQIRSAVRLVEDLVSQHKPILFVGTKKQAKVVIRELAESCAEFYVCERWLGGMLTNLSTIRQSIKTLERIEKRIAAGGEGLTKKEISQLSKEQQKLERNLSGIRGMRKTPGLLVIVDSEHEKTAVLEAKKLGIPVLALVDTNGDPDLIDHVIACNDDSLKSIKLILGALVDAIIEKKKELRIPISPSEEEIESKDDGEPIEEEESTKEEE